MAKLLFILLFLAVWLTAHALQADEERSIRTLFESKHAINRAAHAAAQQLDESELADGVIAIDEEAAFSAAMTYLQRNLKLDRNGEPMPGSRLKEQVLIDDYKVINSGTNFPYTYRNDKYGYEVTLDRPGVVLIVRIVYPRMFSAMEPIVWHVKGTAELTSFF